ncbi:hypothetical protein GGR55DRAFT_105155 [Xylaria sp. FL0064]|nr:hypothetical protein GGR55DRAFT_105155 [Xylaria sp. FL0064]
MATAQTAPPISENTGRRGSAKTNGGQNNRSDFDLYADVLYSFSARPSSWTLYSGEHYHALSQFLIRNADLRNAPRPTADLPDFATVHSFGTLDNGKAQHKVNHERDPDAFSESWSQLQGNRLLFLRGYPSADWLCHIGRELNLEYEFYYQHFSLVSQLSIAESYSHPPLSLISTDTIQLTFTSIGSWDNHGSGIDLTSARARLGEDMKAFLEDLNRNQGPKLCDSIVREFEVHDLEHFSIEQLVTVKLLRYKAFWTLLIWTDFGTSLSKSHRGPWRAIEQFHASASRFLAVPLHHSNSNIKRLPTATSRVRQDTGRGTVAQEFSQTLSSLHTDLGVLADKDTMGNDPTYYLDELFMLLASSEYQFLNLMEVKVRRKSQWGEDIRQIIAELHRTQRVVEQHTQRLLDVLDIIRHRTPFQQLQIEHPEQENVGNSVKADRPLHSIFSKLLRRAETVSSLCHEEMQVLSNDAVIRESQESLEQAGALAKVTFIAFVFVPLSFTTSFSGMNISILNGGSVNLWVWSVVSVPILAFSILAWWADAVKYEAC